MDQGEKSKYRQGRKETYRIQQRNWSIKLRSFFWSVGLFFESYTDSREIVP